MNKEWSKQNKEIQILFTDSYEKSRICMKD